jgi:hypothetical protein
MAKKKQTLRSGHDVNVDLIGISCHLRSYRISFAINNMLGFDFRRIDDFSLPAAAGATIDFPFLLYEDAERKNHFCLVGNHHSQGKLIPALGQVDYFLLATEPLDTDTLNNMISKIRSIPQVNAVYKIDPSKVRDLGILLEEMELHLLDARMKRSGKRC